MIKYGVVMAGGSGKRLSPLSDTISKHLLALYDKPVIYYPISLLMLIKIKNILIICNNKDIRNYKKIFGNGSRLGINIKYKIQKKPTGIPEAFSLSSKFVKKENFVLILGDNFFYGNKFIDVLKKLSKQFKHGCQIFTSNQKQIHLFGALLKKDNQFYLEEKPKHSNFNKAIVGLYFFDFTALDKYKKIKPSKRNETEMIDLIKLYNNENKISHFHMNKSIKWFDIGSYDSLLNASNYVKLLQKNNKILVSYIEKIALDNSWITKSHFKKLIKNNISNYYNNLRKLNISSH